MSDWKEYNLADIYEFSSGLSKGREHFGFGHGFLSYMDIFDNYFLPDQLINLVNSTDKERTTCSIKRGDVFLTRTSETDEELGMSSVATKDYPDATFNGFTKRLRPKGKLLILPEFAGFYFRSPKFRAIVSGMSSMTTRASLNNGMLSGINITIPPLMEQIAISKLLVSLHCKIDLLHRQNNTLEQLAETLFRQNFIEEVEENWEVGDIYNFLFVEYGYPFDSTIFNDKSKGMPLIRIRDIKSNNTECYTTEEYDSKYLVRKGDLLIGMDGEFRLQIWRGENALLNQRVCRFRPKSEFISPFFISSLMKPYLNYYENTKVGTTVIHLGKSDLDEIRIKIPPIEKIKAYSLISNSLYKKLINNFMQINSLTKLRDTLLPKLMSGEVRVK